MLLKQKSKNVTARNGVRPQWQLVYGYDGMAAVIEDKQQKGWEYRDKQKG